MDQAKDEGMIKFAQLIVLIAFSTGCGRYQGEIEQLQTRITQLESQQQGEAEADQSDSNCKVTEVENVGALIECGQGDNKTSALISNGVDGADGEDAALTDNVQVVIEYIYPCGEEEGANEVILKLSDGTLLGHYSQGQKQYLTVLSPGSYVTSDEYRCEFTVTEELEIISNFENAIESN